MYLIKCCANPSLYQFTTTKNVSERFEWNLIQEFLYLSLVEQLVEAYDDNTKL